jgi:DNA-binding NarL/FixJ family response regulator
MDLAAHANDPRVLLATTRPPVRLFFESLGLRLELVVVDHDWAPLDPEHAARADLAIVDVAPDAWAATELCRELRVHRADLPIVALICCPQAVTPWNLRGLLAAGVTSLLDLGEREDDARRAILSAARGDAVLRLHVARGGGLLHEVFGGRPTQSETRVRLLELVARGLSDQEIGRRMHLSPHTIKHHIEQLRRELGMRNRTELAAWAGRHGFYVPEELAARAVPHE